MHPRATNRGDACRRLRRRAAGTPNSPADRTCYGPGERGCLFVATAMELAAHDAEVKQRIGWCFTMVATRLTGGLARA